ncbi:MAG: hypothetical protein Q9191_008398, partial [Dirinaria sp. TL-2023a]
GYTYSVFNLVYETNVASCRIWDALGFKRIGRVKACGNLRSHPDELVDAIIYGRDLGPDGEDFVSEERFDKIHFYLKHGKYPNGADRAEKSRLRSAATHYKLIPAGEGRNGEERLMLKDKEVVANPQRQYEIARQVHAAQHGGINKTTAAIAEHYHWVRIKETVSLAIKNCPECKDATKIPTVRPAADELSASGIEKRPQGGQTSASHQDPNTLIERLVNFDDLDPPPPHTPSVSSHTSAHSLNPPPLYSPSAAAPVAQMHAYHQLQPHLSPSLHDYSSPPAQHHIPLDPQIMHNAQQPPSSPFGHRPEDQLQGYQPSHGGEDAHYELDMSGLDGDAGRGGMGDDTRLATQRHIQHHDEPNLYVHEGHEEESKDDDFLMQ